MAVDEKEGYVRTWARPPVGVTVTEAIEETKRVVVFIQYPRFPELSIVSPQLIISYSIPSKPIFDSFLFL